jgi:sugar-phosphatase
MNGLEAGVTVGLGELPELEAVLFDMDGTLVTSDAAVERAWVQWAGEYEVDPTAALAIAHGRPADDTVRRLRPELGQDAVKEAAARQLFLQYEDLSDVRPTSGAMALLSALERLGLPWAVVTSADRRLAEARLGAAGMVAEVLVTSEDVTAGKPAPEGYLLAAKRLGANIAHCLVVEDSEAGLAAGQAAGALVAALKDLPGDMAIDNLDQLVELFGNYAARQR